MVSVLNDPVLEARTMQMILRHRAGWEPSTPSQTGGSPPTAFWEPAPTIRTRGQAIGSLVASGGMKSRRWTFRSGPSGRVGGAGSIVVLAALVIDAGCSRPRNEPIAAEAADATAPAGAMGAPPSAVPAAVPTVRARLQVELSGGSHGIVRASAGGIDCPRICEGLYPLGQSVTLTAVAAIGTPFLRWSGACAGSGECTVAVDGDKTVVATFGARGAVLSSIPLEVIPATLSGAYALLVTENTAFLAGSFRETLTIAGRPIVSARDADAWLAALTLDGRLRWLKSFPGPGTEGFSSLAPGGGGDLNRRRRRVRKLRPAEYRDEAGALLPGTRMGLPPNASGVAVLPDGGFVVSGDFFREIQVAGKTLVSTGMGSDPYVARYSATGTPVWAVSFAGMGQEQTRPPAVDDRGDVFILGSYYGENLRIGDRDYRNRGMTDLFLAKLSGVDGHVIWSRSLGTATADRGTEILGDGDSVVISGYGGPDLDLGAGPVGGAGAFVARLAGSSGELVWSTALAGRAYVLARTPDALYAAGELLAKLIPWCNVRDAGATI